MISFNLFEKIVDPIKSKITTDPIERSKRLSAIRIRLKQQTNLNDNLFDRKVFQKIGKGIRHVFVDDASSSAFGTVKSRQFRDRNKNRKIDSELQDSKNSSAVEYPPTEST